MVIAGPTAIGKTDVAIQLAKRIDGEILNADSMQVYRYMEIGTAKPTLFDREQAPFHLIDLVNPDEPFTVADWQRLAIQSIDDCRTRDQLPILCGGTGFYLRALLQGWTMANSPSSPLIRLRLTHEAELKGIETLHQRLLLIDEGTAYRLHPNDAHRIIRALEVWEITGITLSEWQRRDRETRVEIPNRFFCLRLSRPTLIERIERRVLKMRDEGLTQEVENLLIRGFTSNLASMRSLGYKEICQYLKGDFDEDEAYKQIVRNTQQYSRRQMTWFRSENNVEWIDVDGQSPDMIADHILTLL